MRILVFAYACEPGSGSEPGAGWAFARMLARLGETTVVTRANNRDLIEAGLEGANEREQLRFVYVDLPGWARFWKRGGRGIHAYSVLWQWAALRAARRLGPPERWDLVWHATLANSWLGSVAPLAGSPAVLGPVGGGVSVPVRAYGALGPRGMATEIARSTVRGIFRYANPLARSAWRRSTLILTQNPETREWFPARHRHKVRVFPNVVLDAAAPGPTDGRAGREAQAPGGGGGPTALYAGRLVAWKGVRLAVRALAALPGWRLELLGGGKDEASLRTLAARLGIEDRVAFRGPVPRAEVLAAIRRADVFVYPSLREEAGWAVAEALHEGVPTVCVDRGGPPVLGATAVPAGAPADMVASIAEALRATSREAPPPLRFDLETRWALLRAELEEAGLVPVRPAP